MTIARMPNEGIMIVKRDAIEDGLAHEIIRFINNTDRAQVCGRHLIELTTSEALNLYAPELRDDPSERREILMAIGALAMTGQNILLGIRVDDADTPKDTFGYLNALKGSIKDPVSAGTIRGTFPHPRCDGYNQYGFWFQAPFFTQNRVHVPDSDDALAEIESLAMQRGITPQELYGRTGREA